MPIPDYQALMLPLLRLVEAKGEIGVGKAVDELAMGMGLTEAERSELLPSGRQSVFANRVHWAATYLVKAGILERPRRGILRVTERGSEVLRDQPERIDNEFLDRYDEFKEFRSRSHSQGDGGPSGDPVSLGQGNSDNLQAPDERILSSHAALVETVAAELLSRLRDADPSFFERAVLDLLEAMGYGTGTVTGRAGDGGIDGEVSRDPLGLEPLFVQAKRYGEGQSVGPADIQAFFGALHMRSATTGVFFTTARFTQGAFDAAERLQARIKLIDGAGLSRLMVRHGVGVRVAETLVLPEIDEGYFE